MKLNLTIIDDSPLWLSLSSKLASQNPLIDKVTVFDNTLDAWVYLQTDHCDLVMTDIEMPGMNGLSFIEMFGSKVAFISSSTVMGYAIVAKELGCVEFMNKPYKKNDFDAVIDYVWDQINAGRKTEKPHKALRTF